VIRGLVVVDQHAVAATGEQPRDREVRRVIARAKARRRQHGAEQRAIGRIVRAVRHVALDDLSAVLEGISALAESEEAFLRTGLEAHAQRVDVAGVVALDAGDEPDHTVGMPRHAHGETAAERVVGIDRRAQPVAVGAHARGPEGAHPSVGRAKAEPGVATAGGFDQHRPAVAVGERHAPRVAGHHGTQCAGVDGEILGEGQRGAEHQRGPGEPGPPLLPRICSDHVRSSPPELFRNKLPA